jgi:hypothetical protein
MWHGFDSDGSFETAAYTIEGTTAKSSGTHFVGEEQYNFRGSTVFAPDLMSCVEKQEISVDGKTWMPWNKSRWTKIKSSPK